MSVRSAGGACLYLRGSASSAWHIDQMGPPPRLGWLSMCTEQCAVMDVNSNMFVAGGGVGQLGMAHRSDGPASSLRMFGHVHRAMCGGGCQFEVLEEHVGARRGVGGTSESVGGCWRSLEDVGCRWRMSVRGDIAGPRPEYRSLTGPGYRP